VRSGGASADTQSIPINVSDLPCGAYTVRLLTGRTILTAVFVK
jgi:hypothetical protein